MHQPKNELLELAEQFYQEEQEEPVILGIDPAIASIGFGVIQGNRAIDYGVISTEAHTPIWKRLESIEADVKELLENFKPSEVAMEMPFYGRENTNAAKVLRATGVIHLAVGKYLGRDPVWLHQSQVKAAVWKGNASKSEVQAAVTRLFDLPGLPKPDDAADGLAIAYAAQQGARADIE